MTPITKVKLKKKRFGFAPAIAMAILVSTGAFAQKDLPLNPAITDALYLIDVEKPKQGIGELEKIAAATPTDASLQYYVGYGYLKIKDKEKAKAAFEKGAAMDEKQALNFVGLGYINMLDKKPAEAKVQFDKALGMTKSKSVAVLKAVAEAYNVDNKYSVESVALLNKAKAINPNDPDVHLLLGDTYLIQNVGGNVGTTISAYEMAERCVVPNAKQKSHFDGKAEYKCGAVFEKAKNAEVAVEHYEKAIKFDPEYTPAYRELAQQLYLNKQAARAVEIHDKFLSLTENPENPTYQFEKAFYLFMAKDYVQANQIFEKIAYAPDVKPITLRFYSKSLYEVGEYEKSRGFFEKYMAVAKPEEIESGDYLYYGRTLSKLKQDSLSLVYFQKSYDMNKSQGDLALEIANTYYKMKKFPQAIAAYQELMRARKTPSAQDYYMIGQAFYNNDQIAAADTTFKKFQQMKPELVEGYYWLANVEYKKEEANKTEGSAKPAFDKLLEVATAAAATDPVKNKKYLVAAYGYLGYYWYAKSEAFKAKDMYTKLAAVDPGNKQAADALKTLDAAIKQAQNPQKAKPKNK